MSDALGRVLAGIPRGSGVRMVRVIVTAATATTLTVTLPDGASVTALPVKGMTYTPTPSNGVALVQQGTLPLVIPTP